MAVTAEISELMSSYVEDVFSSFPSSPDQIVAFSPASESDAEEVIDHIAAAYELRTQLQKAGIDLSRGVKRKYSVPTVPVVEAPRKRFAADSNVVPLVAPVWAGEVSDVGSFANSMKVFQSANPLINSSLALTQPPLAIQPTSITPSRVKSTTPDLVLLFSLFDVLEEEDSAWSSPSSSVSSPESSQSFGNNVSNLPQQQLPLTPQQQQQQQQQGQQFESNVIYIDTTAEQLLMNQQRNLRVPSSMSPQQQQQHQQFVETNPNVSSPPACVPDCDHLPTSPVNSPAHQQIRYLQQQQQQQPQLQSQYVEEEDDCASDGSNGQENNVVPNIVYSYQALPWLSPQQQVPQQQQQQQQEVFDQLQLQLAQQLAQRQQQLQQLQQQQQLQLQQQQQHRQKDVDGTSILLSSFVDHLN